MLVSSCAYRLGLNYIIRVPSWQSVLSPGGLSYISATKLGGLIFTGKRLSSERSGIISITRLGKWRLIFLACVNRVFEYLGSSTFETLADSQEEILFSVSVRIDKLHGFCFYAIDGGVNF